jgi:hypothetical protein
MVSNEDGKARGVAGASRFSPVWLWLSIGAALLAIAGSLAGLFAPPIYSGLTATFLPQAIAQDTANLMLISPLMIVLAALALRNSLRAYLLWLGVVTFTVYNYVIYTFSIPFGYLFPLWVAVLGLSIYALIGGIAVASHEAIRASYSRPERVKVTAWVLIIVAVFFAFVWLSEDVPALLAGTAPASVIAMALPTNPVHILDLAFFLPAVIITGVMLIKRVALGYALAPAFLVFLVLTGVPILLTPVVQPLIDQVPAWGVALPIGLLTLVLVVVVGWLVASIRDNP